MESQDTNFEYNYKQH